MNNEGTDKIKQIYTDFKIKLDSILEKRKLLFRLYRSRLEEEKIKEIKNSINNLPK